MSRFNADQRTTAIGAVLITAGAIVGGLFGSTMDSDLGIVAGILVGAVLGVLLYGWLVEEKSLAVRTYTSTSAPQDDDDDGDYPMGDPFRSPWS